MPIALTGAVMRRWAIKCAALADDPRASGAERARLLKMRTALVEVAETQDWLDGRTIEKPNLQQTA